MSTALAALTPLADSAAIRSASEPSQSELHDYVDEFGTTWVITFRVGAGHGRRSVTDGDEIIIERVQLGRVDVDVGRLGHGFIQSATDAIEEHALEQEANS